ncbi:hypothetical protein C495_08010 [Natronorubrum sulfidifaciens JCM 14089]|uniref:Uncharacterized protein n=1 Tax=Natronorubrum sulfidifaciens JCM 14089 TaxID=1230460 RepID=L9W8K6_9EURY|nr:hypothetical protein C495_08010 [Natronorubrum sulfidifaciens JCM 14089]
MTGREKEIVRHLSEDDLNRLLTQTDNEMMSKGSLSSNGCIRVQRSKMQPMMSECRNLLEVAGLPFGMRVVLGS